MRPDEFEETGRVIVAAYEALAGGHMTEEYAEELSSVRRRATGAEVLVAVTDHVLGSVTLVPDAASPWAELLEDGEAGIRMLAVLPAAQGQGIGKALLEACVARARELGRAAIILHTTPWMTTAQKMYEQEGFERLPDRDWLPVPEVPLLAYRLGLD